MLPGRYRSGTQVPCDPPFACHAYASNLEGPEMTRARSAPMNILLLSRYTRLGASSRLRTMQYLPVLKREGFNVQVSPFFDDAYLDVLYSGEGTRRSTIDYMFQRVSQIRCRPKPDLIWRLCLGSRGLSNAQFCHAGFRSSAIMTTPSFTAMTNTGAQWFEHYLAARSGG